MNQKSTEILNFLGGVTPLAFNFGAHSFAYAKDGAVTFRLKGSKKANIVWILPDQSGCYSIDFYWSKGHRHQAQLVGSFTGVEGKGLLPIIAGFTG